MNLDFFWKQLFSYNIVLIETEFLGLAKMTNFVFAKFTVAQSEFAKHCL